MAISILSILALGILGLWVFWAWIFWGGTEFEIRMCLNIGYVTRYLNFAP